MQEECSADIQIQPDETYTTSLRGITKTHTTLKEAITEIQNKAKAWDKPIPCTITTKDGTWPVQIPKEGNPTLNQTAKTLAIQATKPARPPALPIPKKLKIIETIPLKPL